MARVARRGFALAIIVVAVSLAFLVLFSGLAWRRVVVGVVDHKSIVVEDNGVSRVVAVYTPSGVNVKDERLLNASGSGSLVEAAARLYGASRIYCGIGLRLDYPDPVNGLKAGDTVTYILRGEKCLKYFDRIRVGSRALLVLGFFEKTEALEAYGP